MSSFVRFHKKCPGAHPVTTISAILAADASSIYSGGTGILLSVVELDLALC
jgi:hypothetical protein